MCTNTPDAAGAVPETDEPGIMPFSDVVQFHGHLCPGVTLGYCAARIAIKELRSGRDVDEELLAIVENDACGVDAIQAVTGCTVGKGNLIFRDYGKNVYTFINRATGDAVRISLKNREDEQESGFRELRARVVQGRATPEEAVTMRSMMQAQVDRMLVEPPEKYFEIRHVEVEIPEKARLFNSVQCSKCGEMMAESRARVENGGLVCIPCWDEYTRGW